MRTTAMLTVTTRDGTRIAYEKRGEGRPLIVIGGSLADYAQLGDGMVPTELAAAVTAPTIVLAPEAMTEAAQQIAAASPNGRLVPMQAPTHAADPAEIAQKLFHELDSSPGCLKPGRRRRTTP